MRPRHLKSERNVHNNKGEPMRNFLSMSLAASFAIAALNTMPANANDFDTAAKNEKRAAGQEFKAERDAARGDFHGARKHEENMRLDEHKVNKDIRRGEWKGY